MRVTINVDEELKTQLEIISAAEKKKIGEVADEAIKEYIDKKFQSSGNGKSILSIGDYELKVKKVG
jgi:predicted transcriptional regulator